jgi:hypothetical protein
MTPASLRSIWPLWTLVVATWIAESGMTACRPIATRAQIDPAIANSAAPAETLALRETLPPPSYALRCDEVRAPAARAEWTVGATLVACTVVTPASGEAPRPVATSTFARSLRWEIVPAGAVAIGAVIENPRTTPTRGLASIARSPVAASSDGDDGALYGATNVAAWIDFDARPTGRLRLSSTVIRLHATPLGGGRDIVIGGPLRALRETASPKAARPFPELVAIRAAAGGYAGDCHEEDAVFGAAPASQGGLSVEGQPTYCVFHPR